MSLSIRPGGDGPAAKLFAEGRHTFHRAWFERAFDLLAQAVALDPDEPVARAYHVLASRLLGHRPTAAAIDSIRERLDGTAASTRSLVSAVLTHAEKDHAGALSHVRRYVELEPRDEYGRHMLGYLLFDLGRHDEAAEVLEALLEDRPGYTPAMNHLGYARLALGDDEGGMTQLRRFVELDPDNPSAHDSLADGLEATGDREGAVAQLLRAVLVDGRFAYGWRHLGESLEAQGELGPALAAYRRAESSAAVYGPAFVENVRDQIARLAATVDPSPGGDG